MSIENIVQSFSGYKTIIVGIAMIIVGMYNSDNALTLQGLGLIALRLGIAKIDK